MSSGADVVRCLPIALVEGSLNESPKLRSVGLEAIESREELRRWSVDVEHIGHDRIDALPS